MRSYIVFGQNPLILKYLVVLLVLIFMILTISYRKGTLPKNLDVSLEDDFIYLTHPPKDVADLVKKQCYNCHSAKAAYPQKAHFAPFHEKYIAPVTKGREKLNFSNWAIYSPEMQKVLLLIAVEQMENQAMPITDIFPQGDDTLTQNDKKLLIQWLAQEAEAGM